MICNHVGLLIWDEEYLRSRDGWYRSVVFRDKVARLSIPVLLLINILNLCVDGDFLVVYSKFSVTRDLADLDVLSFTTKEGLTFQTYRSLSKFLASFIRLSTFWGEFCM